MVDGLVLAPGTVHLWRAKLLCSENQMADCESVLSPEEMANAKRFIKQSDQIKFMVSKAMTRKVLSRYLNCTPEKIVFHIGEHGKPFIAETDLQFNVSHAGDYFLLGVTLKNKIGVDIEHEKKAVDYVGIAERFFALSEYETIAQLPVAKQKAAFYRCWTLKEAFIKATGLGLSFGLSNFEVDAIERGDQSKLLRVNGKAADAQAWTLLSIALPNLSGYFAAVAVEGTNHQLDCFDVTIDKLIHDR